MSLLGTLTILGYVAGTKARLSEEWDLALSFSGNVSGDARPRVFFLGDSHTVCIMAAAQQIDAETLPCTVFASRFEKVKRETGAKIVGVTVDAAVEMLTAASKDDILVSLVGGNQFNAIGMMQHPEPFNFFAPDSDNADILPGEHLIPVHAIESMFNKYAGKARQNFLVEAKEYFKGRLFHAVPPPPKFDNEFIRLHAETLFRDRGIETYGVTRPEVRMKLWQAQVRAMRRLYEPLGIGVLMPPPECVDAGGYLKNEAYGPDATHANDLYGRHVIGQVVAMIDDANARGVDA